MRFEDRSGELADPGFNPLRIRRRWGGTARADRRFSALLLIAGFREAVDGDLGGIGQQLGRAVLADGKLEQLGRLVDEPGGAAAGEEVGVLDQVEQERDVGLHAADPEFLEAALHAPGRIDEPPAGGGDLHQQRIVKRRDDPAGESPGRRRAGCPGRRPSDSGVIRP